MIVRWVEVEWLWGTVGHPRVNHLSSHGDQTPFECDTFVSVVSSPSSELRPLQLISVEKLQSLERGSYCLSNFRSPRLVADLKSLVVSFLRVAAVGVWPLLGHD